MFKKCLGFLIHLVKLVCLLVVMTAFTYIPYGYYLNLGVMIAALWCLVK